MTDVVSIALYKAQLDSSNFKAGTEDVKRASEQAAAAVDKMGTSIEKASAKTSTSGASFEKWVGHLDASARAMQTHERELERLAQFQASGTIAGDRLRDAAAAIEASFHKATGATSFFGDALGLGTRALGAFGIGLSAVGAIQFAEHLISDTAALKDQADALRIDTDHLQVYRNVMRGAGVDASAADNFIRKMMMQIGAAEEGTGGAREAFRALGIDWHDVARSADQLDAAIQMVSTSLDTMKDRNRATKNEFDLTGKAGAGVTAALHEMRRGFQDLHDQQERNGGIMDSSSIEHANAVLNQFDQGWTKVKAALAEPLIGVIQMTVDAGSVFAYKMGGAGAVGAPPKVKNPFDLATAQLSPLAAQQSAARAKAESDRVLNAWADDFREKMNRDAEAQTLFNNLLDAAKTKAADFGDVVPKTFKGLLDYLGPANVEMVKMLTNQQRAIEYARQHANDPIKLPPVFRADPNGGLSDLSQMLSKNEDLSEKYAKVANDNIDRLKEQLRLTGLLPDEREKELAVLDAIRTSHGEITDAQKQQIRDLIDQRQEMERLAAAAAEYAQRVQSLKIDLINTTGAALDKMIGHGAGQGLGGSYGGQIGGFIGSNWGPIGEAVGKQLGAMVGGLIGGLFRSSDKAYAAFGANGQLTFSGKAGNNGLAQTAGDSINAAIKSLTGYGVDFTDTISKIAIGKKDLSFYQLGSQSSLQRIDSRGDPAALAKAVVDQLLKSANISDANLKQVLTGNTFASVDQLNAAADFVTNTYDAIAQARKPLSDVEQAMKALADSFKSAKDQAQQLGLAIDPLVAGAKKQFNDSIADQIRAIEDPLGAALDLEAKNAAARLAAAQAFGADIAQVEKLNTLLAQQVKDQYQSQQVSGLKSLIDNVTFGNLSGQTQQQQFFAAATRYNAARSTALANPSNANALSDFEGVAQSYLGIARNFLGTSQRYGQIEADVVGTARTLGGDAADPSGIGKALIAATTGSGAAMVLKLGDVQAAIEALTAQQAETNAELKALARKVA